MPTKSPKPRDSLRKRTLAAISILDARARLIPDPITPENFLRKVVSSTWFQKTYGRELLSYGEHFTDWFLHRGSATYWGFGIAAQPWSRAGVLKSVAHRITGPYHNWEFAIVYAVLVRHFMGANAYELLKANYKVHKVRTRKPRDGSKRWHQWQAQKRRPR
jgi:hypothetical protein